MLWTALTDPSIDPLAVLEREPTARQRHDRGSLISQRDGAVPIEVWTETELACLHALSWLANERDDHTLRERLDAALAWHLDHLQPDNATNHPWAVHVFVAASLNDSSSAGGSAMLYAETLLHNCRVSLGRPDAFSAELLLDAADALDNAAAAK